MTCVIVAAVSTIVATTTADITAARPQQQLLLDLLLILLIQAICGIKFLLKIIDIGFDQIDRCVRCQNSNIQL